MKNIIKLINNLFYNEKVSFVLNRIESNLNDCEIKPIRRGSSLEFIKEKISISVTGGMEDTSYFCQGYDHLNQKYIFYKLGLFDSIRIEKLINKAYKRNVKIEDKIVKCYNV